MNILEKLSDYGENDFFVKTDTLARLFGLSTRRICQLVEAGVIETSSPPGVKPRVFDLRDCVPQYATFLQSGVALADWAG